MENNVVHVDYGSDVGNGREGGHILVFVGSEYGRLGSVMDLDYECFFFLGRKRRSGVSVAMKRGEGLLLAE